MNLDIAIVTYNRLEKLKKTLQHYCDQTASFRNLIIVNNSSTDGTGDYLERWIEDFKQQGCKTFNPILITTKENLGGAGGFYLGQKKALELGADWLMVADDDAYAEPNMVEEFYNYVKSHECIKIAAICAAVWSTLGEIACQHRDTWHLKDGKFFVKEKSKIQDYYKAEFEIDLFSYVGTFLNVKIMSQCGLVNPNYFIYYDDSEHSFRMKSKGRILVVPNIRIVHEDWTPTKLDSNEVASWRDYYLTRNMYHMLFLHLPKIAYRYLWWHIRDWAKGKIAKTPKSLVENDAIWDAFWGNLGKHKKYVPGWTSTEWKI